MGIRSALTLRRTQAAVQEGITAGIYTGRAFDTSHLPMANPWSTSALERWAYQDMFGDAPVGTRESAMAVPPFARARNLVVASAAKLPLVLIDPAKVITLPDGTEDYSAAIVEDQPNWLTQCGDGSSPELRTGWTVDDLIWNGVSLWWRNDSGKASETRQRVNLDEWEIDPDRREVLVNGKAADPSEIILFIGFHEGVLSFGRETILDARKLVRIVSDRIDNPVARTELHQTGGPAISDEKKKELLAEYRASRNEPGGAVSFTSQYLQIIEHGTDDDGSFLIGGRNAMAVDAARVIGVHSSQIDASGVNSTLTYETKEGRNQEFKDVDLDLYLVPMAARLSMDDVSPKRTRVAFNARQFTTPTPSPFGSEMSD